MSAKAAASNGSSSAKRSLDALDQIVLGGTTVSTAAEDDSFVASSQWNGSRPGYYFGTGPLGKGYYRDQDNNINHESSANNNRQEQSGAPKKKQRKGVQFDDDRNETRFIAPTVQQLLEDAEQQQQQYRVLDLTSKSVVQTATKALVKAVEYNAIQRAAHAHEPASYMDSEVALYENIAILKALAADPARLYPAMLESTTTTTTTTSTGNTHDEPLLMPTLIQLLWHENTDIVTSVVAVLLEWLDASLLVDEQQQPEDAPGSSLVIPVASVAAFFLQQQGADFLVGNLGRLQQQPGAATAAGDDDDDDEVGKGIEDILSLLENLLEMDQVLQMAGVGESVPSLIADGRSVAAMLCQDTLLVSWLFQQVQQGDSDQSTLSFLQNRSLELLALLSPREDVHTALPDWSKIPQYKSTLLDDDADDDKKPAATNGESRDGSSSSATGLVDGIEILLQAIAVYRKKQPGNDAQIECLENACIILASALTYSSKNVQAFLDRQGVELVIRCLKERCHAGGAALKLLDFSGSDPVHQKACEHMVTAGALKYLFPLFMGKSVPKMAPSAITSKKAKRDWANMIETTTIRILYALVHKLKDDSPDDAKQRLLAKFVGDERCDRLVEQCLAYDQKARLAEYKFFRSDIEEEMPDEDAVQLAALNAKLARGGDIFHRLTAIAAFCCVGSKRCHERILAQLLLQQSGISLVRDGLEEFVSVLEESYQRKQLESYLEDL